MKIEEKYSEITLDGAKEVYTSIHNLDDTTTIGQIKQFMIERQELLKEMEEKENKRLKGMVGKYYAITFTNFSIKPNVCIFLSHIQQNDGYDFICKSIHYYNGSIEYKDYDIIKYSDFNNDGLQTVREITKADFHKALDKYRDLQTDFLNYN